MLRSRLLAGVGLGLGILLAIAGLAVTLSLVGIGIWLETPAAPKPDVTTATIGLVLVGLSGYAVFRGGWLMLKAARTALRTPLAD
ncbi:hypothetical protein GCM10027515_11330 [Schumannella luteola]|uniref:Uncharacterized protein n=1 Tax=Schumannella luteola TaxID=472059 RepID=A0A852Y8M8_9MICO|nr:hypothetical protein [Schumannella luteola]NYG97581.1 hypothetical protein [Schumannella luteola]TPX01570.1 hypothetical protein FJ656_26720 [Schumannella luteola]